MAFMLYHISRLKALLKFHWQREECRKEFTEEFSVFLHALRAFVSFYRFCVEAKGWFKYHSRLTLINNEIYAWRIFKAPLDNERNVNSATKAFIEATSVNAVINNWGIWLLAWRSQFNEERNLKSIPSCRCSNKKFQINKTKKSKARKNCGDEENVWKEFVSRALCWEAMTCKFALKLSVELSNYFSPVFSSTSGRKRLHNHEQICQNKRFVFMKRVHCLSSTPFRPRKLFSTLQAF